MGYIGLMDCNNFFVSCERLFRPDLVGKPVAVLSSNDGCIVARSQEVKDMGVPMGIPLFQAKQLVDMSQVTLFSSNFPLYRDISSRVMRTLADEVGACELYSIDEAFFTLNATTTTDELMALRAEIMRRTGIPVSIGLAPTKTIAKAASKLAKQHGGVRKLSLSAWREAAAIYPIGDVWNLGRATARKLSSFGVTTVPAFMANDPAWIDRQFGIMGRRLHDELNGRSVYALHDTSAVLRQSIASTRSFASTTNEQSALLGALTYHLTHVAEKLRAQKLLAAWIVVELRASRHSDFAYRPGTVMVPLARPSNTTVELLRQVEAGLLALYEPGVPYKKAGIVAGGLLPEAAVQPTLFGEAVIVPTTRAVDAVVDALNKRLGPGSIRPGTMLDSRPKTSASLRSPSYTTVWKDIPIITAK